MCGCLGTKQPMAIQKWGPEDGGFAHMDFQEEFSDMSFFGGKLSAVSFSANCVYLAPRHETAFFSKQSHA